MKFVIMRVKGFGVYGRDRLEYLITIRINASQAQRVNRLFMSTACICGGRHWEWDLSKGEAKLGCQVDGNHFEIGKVLGELIPYDLDSKF